MQLDNIHGSVLFHGRDEHGEIVVAEEGNKRSLYFDAGIVQSTIRTDKPDQLLEDYNEAMMCGLIFRPQPQSVLLIGLGGCSLVHFLLKAVPQCALDVVEIRQLVVDLSHEFFFLPRDRPLLRIFHGAGDDFIRNQDANARKYELIIVDAFDEAGPAASLLEKEFLCSCRRRLAENGVFAINLWNSPAHDFSARYSSIHDAFAHNALKLLPVESYRNAVAFGFEHPLAHLPDYRSTAAGLRKKYRINFPRYLKYLYWQNFNEHKQ